MVNLELELITSLQFLHFAKSSSGPDWTLRQAAGHKFDAPGVYDIQFYITIFVICDMVFLRLHSTKLNLMASS